MKQQLCSECSLFVLVQNHHKTLPNQKGLYSLAISVTAHSVKQWRNWTFLKNSSVQSTSLQAITPLVCITLHSSKLTLHATHVHPGFQPSLPKALLEATLQTTALTKVLHKSQDIACSSAGRKPACRFAVRQLCRLHWGWNKPYIPSLSTPRHTCDIPGSAPVSEGTWLSILSYKEPKCFFCLKCHSQCSLGHFSSYSAYSAICACFWLGCDEWIEQRQKCLGFLFALSKEPLTLYICFCFPFCSAQPGSDSSKSFTGMKNKATHHHPMLRFSLKFKDLMFPFPLEVFLESLGIQSVFGSLNCITSPSVLASRRKPMLIKREGCFHIVKMTGEAWIPNILLTALALVLHNVCLEKGPCTLLFQQLS